MTTLAMFNNKGGVGKTTLTYHLAHMLSRLGTRVLAVDLDPQANLTAHFLDEPELESLWGGEDEQGRQTAAGAVYPIVEGLGGVDLVEPRMIAENLWLLPGDLGLSRFEERLAQEWPATLAGGNNAATRTTLALDRITREAAAATAADVVLIDVGPSLGALNRAALLAAEHVLIPLGADLFSVQGLQNLGPALRRWRTDWQETALPRVSESLAPPAGLMQPLGYVVMQPSMRLDRPVQAYQRWLRRIPDVYAHDVLGDEPPAHGLRGEIATVRNYRSLMPLAHDARKPMFDLRAADGAVGSTQRYVQTCFSEFRQLALDVQARLRAADADAVGGSA